MPKNEIEKPVPTDIEHVEVAAIEQGALAVIERAEIDMQISTAKKYPRSITEFVRKASEIISLDTDTAMSCIYRRPVGRDAGKGQKIVEGQSIRFAEIIFSTYGNMRVSDVIAEMTPRWVKAIGYAIDLESNTAVRREVVESTVKRDGRPFSERMRIVAAKAAASKARRDAMLSVIPKGLLKQLEKLARDVAFGKGDKMTMKKRRDNVLVWAEKMGIDKKRLFQTIDVKGVDDIGLEELAQLVGLKTAIQDGDITIEEAFPPIEDEKPETDAKGVQGVKAKLGVKEQKKKKASKKKKPEPEPQAAEPEPESEQEEEEIPQWQCQACKRLVDNPLDKGGKPQCPHCLAVGKIGANPALK